MRRLKLLAISASLALSVCSHLQVHALSINFTVFLAPGRWDLDWRAEATIREFVMFFRAQRPTRIIVHGYADSVGSAQANQLLSERRAETVRRALLAEGISASARGFGETNFAVPSPENTPEQRNRRVVIVFQ